MPNCKKIWRVENISECYNAKTGEAVPYLTYEKPFPPEDAGGPRVVSEDGQDATLEELVELCDHAAENCNAHEYCGTHRLLGAVLYRKLGRQIATELMLDIATRGGLHGMAGIYSRSDSYGDLDVGKNGHDWDGNYGA